jgi:hypothetical protein
MVNTQRPLEEAWGRKAKRLADQLLETGCQDEFTGVFESYLVAHLNGHFRTQPDLSPTQRALDWAAQRRGRVRMDDLARLAGLSTRQFRRLCLELTPYVADVIAGSALRLPAKFRSLDVYAKVDGKWIQVGSNIDFHPETLEAQRQQLMPLSPAQRKHLLAAREAVWRAFFANDRAVLERVIPEETIAINPAADRWDNRKAVLEGAAQFAQAGGKLVRIEFPQTEIQMYGDVAILYSTYLYELEVQGKTSTQSGRATETFVRRKGTWVNPGWHLDSGK